MKRASPAVTEPVTAVRRGKGRPEPVANGGSQRASDPIWPANVLTSRHWLSVWLSGVVVAGVSHLRGVVRVVAALCVLKALTFAHCGCSRSRRSAEEEQSLRLDDGAADGDDTDGTRNSTARSCSPTNERAAQSALSVTRSAAAAAAARTKLVGRDRRASVRTNTHAPRDGRAPTDGHWAAQVGLPAARAADSRRHVAEQSGPIDSLQRRRLAIMASGGGGRPAARAAARVSSASLYWIGDP